MKILKSFFFLTILTLAFTSCETIEDEEVVPEVEVQSFSMTVNSTSTTIEINWTDIEEASWYFVHYGPTSEDKIVTGGYQNLNTNAMQYTLTNLTPNTEYEFWVEGKTHLTGGDLVAKSSTLSVMTQE